jgi:hypothetical protein
VTLINGLITKFHLLLHLVLFLKNKKKEEIKEEKKEDVIIEEGKIKEDEPKIETIVAEE